MKHLREIDRGTTHRADGPGRERDRDDPQPRATTAPRPTRAVRRGRARRAHAATSRPTRGARAGAAGDLAGRRARKAAGTWSEVFGPGPAGEEIFMAWHFARYAEAVTAAGKKEYPLPMFVNAALIRPGHQPGQYPSGGPLPHLADVWRAGGAERRLPRARHLLPELRRVGRDATSGAGNPLFVPEAHAQPRGVGQRALRVRRARRDRLLAVRHRDDRRARREAPRGQLRPLGAARARSCSSARDKGRCRRACCPRGRSSASRSRCASAATCSRRRSSGARRRPWPTG